MPVFRDRQSTVRQGFLLLLLLAASAVALSGCGSSLLQYYFGDTFGSGDTVEQTPEQLVWEGVQKMQEKDYGDALKAFQKIKERYPYSKYAILAELKVADAHFHREEYADAALAYEEFIRLHPRNEVVPYVLYQLGMCRFLSARSVDRDQEETRLAMETFRRLTEAFPESEYRAKAQEKILECRKRLATHEYNVSRVYYRMEKYRAAKLRITALLEAYPEAVEELGYTEELEQMMAHCDEYLNKEGDGRSVWTRLGF